MDFYYNDGSKPFLSVLLSANATALKDEEEKKQQREGSSSSSSSTSSSSAELSDSQVQEVVDTMIKVSAEQRRAAAAADEEHGKKESEEPEIPRELAHVEQAEAELAQERAERQQRRDNLPQLELKRFTLGTKPNVKEQQQQQRAETQIYSGDDKASSSTAVGTSDDPFRMRLAEMNRVRDCLVAQAKVPQQEIAEDLATLQKSLDVLKLMIASQQGVPPAEQPSCVGGAKKSEPAVIKKHQDEEATSNPKPLPSFVVVPTLSAAVAVTPAVQNGGKQGAAPSPAASRDRSFVTVAAPEGQVRSKWDFYNRK